MNLFRQGVLKKTGLEEYSGRGMIIFYNDDGCYNDDDDDGNGYSL